MKRFLSFALILAVAATMMLSGVSASATAEGGFSVPAFQAFLIGGRGAAIAPQTVSDSGAAEALGTVLRSAGSRTSLPADAEWLAWFYPGSFQASAFRNGSDGVYQGDTRVKTYRIYTSGEYAYVTFGSECRVVRVQDYQAFLRSVDSLIYSEAAVEVPVFSTGLQPQLKLSGYRYRKLDGQYYQLPDSGSGDVPTVSGGEDRVPLPTGGEYQVKISKDGSALFEGTRTQAAAYKLTSTGVYRVELAQDYRGQYGAAQGTVRYLYDYSYSDGVRITATGNDTHLGEVVVLRVLGAPKGAEITASTDLNFIPRFFDHPDGGRVALLPVSYLNAAGEHWVQVSYGGVAEKFSIVAKDRQWQIQNLTVDPNTTAETVESQAANAEYERVIAPLRSVADNRKYWSGKFILPCSDQKVTTQFGMVRYVNGARTSVRHGALDLAVPLGTPVAATGNGRVLYAGFLQLTGNTIVIEHGFGLKSWHYHMNSLDVSTGDMVTQGQQLGTVGSTGFSTGPHLHFGFSVNNVFINPYTVINSDLLLWG